MEIGKEAILTKCKKRLGALKFVYQTATLQTKKRLTNACDMSKLLYRITVWGTLGHKNISKKAQIVQNLTCCWVINKSRWISAKKLLENLDWLSIHQLATYHTLLIIWKTFNYRTPVRNLSVLER